MTGEPSPASWGRIKVREALRYTLSRRDRFLPTLREMRNMTIKGPGGPLAVRLYVPMDAAEVGPLLVYFHGGGFVCCDLDTHDALCTRLADAGRFRVLSCSYRLAPEASFPAQEEDALAAARWAIANVERLGADLARIGIGGDSAGGYLAARMAKILPGFFRAQILIYPLMHLEDDVWAGVMVSDGRVLGRLAVRAINAELGGAPVHAPSLLVDGALAAVPAVIVAGARLDPCRPDALAAHDQLEALGVSVAYRDFAGLTHGFGNMTHLQAAAREAVAETGYLAGLMLGAP
jgi:acetyl esterase